MRKLKRYWYSVVTLSYNNYFKADVEKTYTFIDPKDKLSDRQIFNRIEENYREEVRLAWEEIASK